MISSKVAKWRFVTAAGLAIVLAGGSWLTSMGTKTAEAQATGSITISASPDPVNTGGNFTATITVNPAAEGFTSIGFSLPVPSGATGVSCTPTPNNCNLSGNQFIFGVISGAPLTAPQIFTATFTAPGSAGELTLDVTGNECIGADSFTEIDCLDTPITVTVEVDEGPTATNTPTNTATATNTRTNTPTRTATATRTSTNTPSATSTAIIGGGGLTPTPTNTSAATVPVQTGTAVPTNPATATNTVRPTDTALPTNTQAGMTNTPTRTNTPASTAVGSSTAGPSGTAGASATSGSGNTSTPTRTGTAPLPPSTGTGSNFGGTSTVAALFLVAIGLGVSGFAATRVTRKR